MTVEDFVKALTEDKSDLNHESISAIYHSFTYDFSKDTLNYNQDQIRSMIKDLSPSDAGRLSIMLGRCSTICKTEIKNLGSISNSSYIESLKKIDKLIDNLRSIFYEEQQKKESSPNNSTATTVAQHGAYLQQIQAKLKNLNDDVIAANKLIDDKIFSLLINTVSILGIFVAIAFAGFGITSLFSNLDYVTAFASKENFIRTIFFLFLIALLSYNLLLLLVYFVFKLSRPILVGLGKKSGEIKEENERQRFTDSIDLKPFFWVDGILLIIVIALFIWGIFSYSSDNNVSPDGNAYVNSETISGETDTGSETTDGEETTE